MICLFNTVFQTLGTVRLQGSYNTEDPSQSKLRITVKPRNRELFFGVFQDTAQSTEMSDVILNLAPTRNTPQFAQISENNSEESAEGSEIEGSETAPTPPSNSDLNYELLPWIFPFGQLEVEYMNQMIEELSFAAKDLRPWKNHEINDTVLMQRMIGRQNLIGQSHSLPMFLTTWKFSVSVDYVCFFLLFYFLNCKQNQNCSRAMLHIIFININEFLCCFVYFFRLELGKHLK